MKRLKQSKGIVALLLAFIMILSGIYFVKPEGNEAKAEAETSSNTGSEQGATVDPEMLNVKVQPGVNEDGSIKALRFITSVNSLDYKEVGFIIDWEGRTEPLRWAVPNNTVYERIESSVGKYMDYTFSPKVVDTSSEYFATGILKVEAEATLYTVKAYVVTYDNQTEYGTSRCVSYEDATSTTYVNASYVSTTEPTDTITGVKSSASTDANETFEANVIGWDKIEDNKYEVHVRVKNVNPNSLPSLTRFTFNTTGTESALVRNLYTSYDKTGEQDETWFKTMLLKNGSEEKFTIATSADLYGLATLVNAGAEGISGKTFYVVSDIDVKGSSSKQWTPIGNATTNKFTGIFDGQGHTISGLYYNGSSANVAMFGIARECTITNFKLEASTFTTSSFPAAGVVAQIESQGILSKIYTNVAITASNNSGGIVGFTLAGATEIDVNECWVNGSISLSGGNSVGGILGKVNQAEVEITNCLNSALVSNTLGAGTDSLGRSGGICGDVTSGGTKNVELTIADCLNIGNISGRNSGYVLGYLGSAGSASNKLHVEVSNCFAKTSGEIQPIAYGSTVSGLTSQFQSVTEENLLGANGYTNTFLNFDNFETEEAFDGIWRAVEGGTPELSYFSNATKTELPHTIRQDTRWYKGDSDTTTSSYTISTPEQLYGLAELSKSNTFSGKTINLGNNITVNATDAETWKNTTPFYQDWTPIAQNANCTFQGTLSGEAECAISGLYATGSTYVGLFGRVHPNGTVCDLKLENSYFDGVSQVGSIAGRGDGTFSNVYSDAIVSCDTAEGYEIGGLIGMIWPESGSAKTISGCWYAGEINVSAKVWRIGGIAGVYRGSIARTFSHCYNSGDITYTATTTMNSGRVGGLLGDLSGAGGTISNCFNSGTIQADVCSGRGSIVGAAYCSSTFTVNNVYATTESCSKSEIHCSVGVNPTKASKLIYSFNKELLLGTGGYINTALNFDDTTTADAYDGYWTARTADVPALRMFVDEAERTTDFEGLTRKDISWYTSTAAGTYTLTTEEQLWGFGLLGQNYNFDGQTIQLGADMNLNDADASTVASWKAGTNVPKQQWLPIGNNKVPFKGTFDGQGNTINGVYYHASGLSVGLFGEIFANATVRNVAITNSYFNNTNTKDSDVEVGSAVGRSEGIVQNVYSNAIVESAQGNAGGIVGVVQYYKYETSLIRTIEKCWFAGEVTVSSYHAGGIVGRVQGASSSTKVNNEQVYTEVTITNCLNTGSVTAKDIGTHGRAAGIVGCIQGYCEATISNTLNTGTITAPQNAYSTVAYKNSSQAKIDVQDTTYEVDGKIVVTGEKGNTAGIVAANTCAESDLYAFNADNINLDKSVWTFYADKTPELTVLAGYLAN